MAGNRTPRSLDGATGNKLESDPFCLHPGPVGLRGPSLVGPLRLELPTPPAQAKAAKPPTPPKPPATPPGPVAPATLRDQVNAQLTKGKFDVTLVADNTRAFFNESRITLNEITDLIYDELHQVSPSVKRADVWSEVWQAHQAKVLEHEQSRWQWVIQMLYTPQYTFGTQPQQSPWMNSLQASVGRNYRAHSYGKSGFEHTLQVSGAFFNLGAGNLDLFQNALGSYQLSYAAPLGREFRFLGVPDWWTNLQGSVFAQLAAGVGANYDKNAAGERTGYLGFLGQAAGGGQLALSLGWLQVIVQGSVVYSWMSPTVAPDSRPTDNVGLQGGVGLGGNF